MHIKYTVVDLFAGAGGLSFGFRKAGFQTIWAADHNVAATETFKRNVDERVVCTAIKPQTDCPHAAVITGGPPCQGFSSAGMRRGGDARNTLVSVFAQVVARIRPEAFVFENVEGFMTSEKGRHVYDLLSPLIGAGYLIHLRKINAANFGIPQHRKRVVAIGGLGFEPTFPAPTHYAFGAPGTHHIARQCSRTLTIADAINSLPQPTTRAPGQPEDHYYTQIDTGRLSKLLLLKQGQTMRDLPEEEWHPSYRRRAYRRVQDGTPTERRGGAPSGMRRLRADQPSKAITAGASSEFVHPYEDRFLTLRECARLQTFPDTFAFYGTKAERALLIGNAVPPKLSEVIAKQLLQDLRTKKRHDIPGALVSFISGPSTAVSPALRRVTDMVNVHFHPLNQQQALL